MSDTNSVEVKVPELGDFHDVPVIEILVVVGDQVDVETPLLTLESDKATMDVPSPVAGTVEQILVAIGDHVDEGTPIVCVRPSAAATTGAAAAPAGAAASAAGAPVAGAAPASAAPTSVAAAPVAPAPAPAPAAAPAAAGVPAAPGPVPAADAAGTGPGSDGVPYASPSVRRLARGLNIDLRTVAGSGRKGRITTEDVQAASRRPVDTGVATDHGGVLTLAPWPQVDFARFGEIERVPLTRIQKIAGPALARNWAMIPHVTQYDEADITELETWRHELNAKKDPDAASITLLAFLVVASVAALKQFPNFNASLDGDELVLRKYYNIGFAADTPQGLVVPVIHDADQKGIRQIATDLSDLSRIARAGKLTPTQMSGSTFTISSLGGIGGTAFTPIINAPEVAILGVSRSSVKPIWDAQAEQFVPRTMLPLSLSYDHRVIDGAAGARFIVHLSKTVSDLRRVLL